MSTKLSWSLFAKVTPEQINFVDCLFDWVLGGEEVTVEWHGNRYIGMNE